MDLRQTTKQEKEVLEWLNDLRELGTIDMFKVFIKIEAKFNVLTEEAKRLVALWVRNFNDSGAYEDVISDLTVKKFVVIAEDDGETIYQTDEVEELYDWCDEILIYAKPTTLEEAINRVEASKMYLITN